MIRQWHVPKETTSDCHSWFFKRNNGDSTLNLLQTPTLSWKLGFPAAEVSPERNLPGLATNHSPVVAELLLKSTQLESPTITHLERLSLASKCTFRNWEFRLRQKCQSPWITPLLLGKKPGTNDYQPVQYLQAINKATAIIYLGVPKP